MDARVADNSKSRGWFAITPGLYESAVSSVDQPILRSLEIWTRCNYPGRKSNAEVSGNLVPRRV